MQLRATHATKNVDSILAISLLAKQYMISGDVLNPESGMLGWSHNNGFHNILKIQMLTTLEREV